MPCDKFADFKGPESYLRKSPATEIVLLGNVAYRMGKSIEYDPATMKVTNLPDANSLLSTNDRQGWELKEE
jgi:glucose-6-phosphate dehydrogenase assembly protein OpcA